MRWLRFFAYFDDGAKYVLEATLNMIRSMTHGKFSELTSWTERCK
jgi:hypothetical protein